MESLKDYLVRIENGPSVVKFCRDRSTSSVRQAIRRTKIIWWESALKRLQNLFEGGTSEDDEDEALAILLAAQDPEELIFYINNLTWSELDDELDEPDLDEISNLLRKLLDRQNYRVDSILRESFGYDPGSGPTRTLAELTPMAGAIPQAVRHALAGELVNRRHRLLNDVALMALRKLPTHIFEFRVLVDSIQSFVQNTGQLQPADQLLQLSWELFYTERICRQLARGEVGPLLDILPHLVNPDPVEYPVIRRVACYEMLRRWASEFEAMDEIVKVVGNANQQRDMLIFMQRRTQFMDNFPPPLAPPSVLMAAISTISTLLGGVAGGFNDLVKAIQATVTTIGNLSAPNLLGNLSDDRATSAANGLAPELLALLPYDYKRELINGILSGTDIVAGVVDDEEQAILKILSESKKRSVAEFLQLARGVSWETLFNAFDGTEYNRLEELFAF